MNDQLITRPPVLLIGKSLVGEKLSKTNVTMRVTLSKWTKTRTANAEDVGVGKKINRYQSEYFINVFEMIRQSLESNVNRAINLNANWVFDLSNDLELFKNKLSVEFIDWKKLLPIVWKTNIIDAETNEDISLALEVDFIDILVIDRSLISNVGNRKNTRKQKIRDILEKDFNVPVDLITQDSTSAVTVKVFNKIVSTNNFYRIDFDLNKLNPFPFYRDSFYIPDFECEKLNVEIRNKINEMSIEDEKFFYALRLDIIFSRLENSDDDGIFEPNYDEDTFFELLENSASHLFT
jgi:hypothetical protein